jgi:predicted CopG family antitoxin
MKFKTLTIKEEVYRELLRIKRKDESFSELFMRMVKKEKPDFKKFYGSWSDLTNKEIKKISEAIRTLRTSADKNFKKRMERLFR